MSNSLVIVDAFTKTAFSGNPAAVCILSEAADEAWMQNVASEMNLSETAFVYPCAATGKFNLRWFTPVVEVALCGHATLAAAHVLWTYSEFESLELITFETLSGELTAQKLSDGSIALDFPSAPCHDFAAPMELFVALGVQSNIVQRNSLDVLIELKSESDVSHVKPDFAALAEVPNIRGVIVTAPAQKDSDPTYDFISRFFAPSVGIDEDPVTGSAHCALGPYWAKRMGKNTLTGYQASKRGGRVCVEVRGDRVILSGCCVTVMTGALNEQIEQHDKE